MEADVKLNKRLYSKDAILHSITEFSSQLKINLIEDDIYYKLGCNYESDNQGLIDELLNYILYQTIILENPT